MLAMLARTAGSDTLSEGLEQQGRVMRSQIADFLMERQAAKMVRDGEVTPELLEQLRGVRQMASMADVMSNATPEQRARIKEGLLGSAGLTPQRLEELSRVEQRMARGAVDEMDEALMEAATKMEREGIDLPLMNPEMLRGMSQQAEPVTGRHVGQMIGRVAGDEIGVLGGLAAGGLLASQLGIQSPKDAEIARLKQQLGQA